MRVRVLSDLHLESNSRYTTPKGGADVVVLAGDIALADEGLQWARTQWASEPVLYVAGNHEFYNAWTNDFSTMSEISARLRTRPAETNVTFLENDELVVGGCRFLGCTLWTDFALYGPVDRVGAMLRGGQFMADYVHIYRERHAPLRPADTLALHQASVHWLEERLGGGFPGPTIVVTHHAPSAKSLAPRFSRDPQAPAFASDLERLCGRERVRLWIHGHTHHSVDYEINATRVISNQRGYRHEGASAGFVDDLVVEI
jgi:predicted phosphodiesterase